MEEEEITEGLKDSFQSLMNDHQNLGAGLELLENEIYSDSPSDEKLKKLIADVELWTTEVNSCVGYLDDARVVSQKMKIIYNLEENK